MLSNIENFLFFKVINDYSLILQTTTTNSEKKNSLLRGPEK